VQEWLIWPVSKTERVVRLTQVQILSPPLMKYEFSAGGIVYKNQKSKIKNQKDKYFILVCQHSGYHGWVFPKGLIGDHVENESKKETAIREVEEETGVFGKIINTLKPVTYWYYWEGDPSTGSGQGKIKKTVYYFLMEYLSGDISKHDFEMEKVEWLEKEKVLDRLTYESDKKSWRVALRAINRRLKVSTSADHQKDDK
jgi:8-oxo-dGTP pyrophosphatase MutT (NUDIX family)